LEVWEEAGDAGKKCESDRWKGAEGSACGAEIGDRKAEQVEIRGVCEDEIAVNRFKIDLRLIE
jgi:hypothetical protein